jgi:hypothetical protein
MLVLPALSQQVVLSGSATSSAGGSGTEGPLRLISIVGQSTPLGASVSTSGSLTLSPGFISLFTISQGTLTVTSPTPGATWIIGSQRTVTWTSQNVTGNVTIKLSTDGGANYETTLALNVANNGSASVSVPNTASNACKVKVESVSNPGISGESNVFTIVFPSLPPFVTVSGTEPFPASPSQSTEYRLVSIPGRNLASVSTFVAGAGAQVYDWRAWRESDQGSGAFVELSSGNAIRRGEGIWLLRKNNFSFQDSIAMPLLDAKGTDTITLHSGWNIIANPFDKPVSWLAVKAENNNIQGAAYAYGGTTPYTQAAQLQPFKAYYFYNDSGWSNLKIPYPFGTQPVQLSQPPPITWQMQLTVASDINTDKLNFVGVAPSAQEQRDALDEYKPPLVFDQSFLYFNRPLWDQRYDKFRSDYRPAIGDGQVWDFEVSNPRLSRTTIAFVGVELIPAEYRVALLCTNGAAVTDLRAKSQIEFRSASKETKFKLLIGTTEFVEDEVQKNRPSVFRLEQNYPNPFNPRTEIQFQIPASSHVKLVVFDLLGREVATLVDGFEEGGFKSVEFDASTLASGAYFYRLEAGKFVEVKKMQLLK